MFREEIFCNDSFSNKPKFSQTEWLHGLRHNTRMNKFLFVSAVQALLGSTKFVESYSDICYNWPLELF
jgi:hypothetical protein